MRCRHDPSHEFTPRRRDQEFCSVWCRRDAWRLTHAAQTAAGTLRLGVSTDAGRTETEASRKELSRV